MPASKEGRPWSSRCTERVLLKPRRSCTEGWETSSRKNVGQNVSSGLTEWAKFAIERRSLLNQRPRTSIRPIDDIAPKSLTPLMQISFFLVFSA